MKPDKRVAFVIGALAMAASGLGSPLPARAAEPVSDYPIRAVSLRDVEIDDAFWRPKLDTNRRVSIPHILRQNELTGRVENFVKAARHSGGFKGRRYNDTDVYKAIEAASYSLVASPDPALDKTLDELIALIAAAQEPDGYIYSARSANPEKPAPGAGSERWSSLHTSHELYNAGHLYEAAVAHFQATGKRTLLQVAIKSADLVCRVFGVDARRDVPGHQEIELALVKLFRVTGDRKYLEQARFFLDERGRTHSVTPPVFAADDPFHIYNDVAYRQDHRPVLEQDRATGHAVRATYMFSGMTDVAAIFGLSSYGRAVDALWRDVTGKRLYLTGGLGSQGTTEAFGDDYVLPNRRAYAETCAAIGGVLWYQRMFLRTGDAAFLDVLERTLYNGVVSGVSLAGDSFFYQNPLESDGRPERTPYFDVACCPANLARLLAQLPGLAYAQREGELFVNLIVGSRARATLGGREVRLVQETRYPWEGRVTLRVEPDQPSDFTLRIRVPGWARGEAVPGELYRFADASAEAASLAVNGARAPLLIESGFLTLRRTWRRGDRVELELPMPVRRVLAHPGVAENRGKAALQRGPIVYCLEAVDNGGTLKDVALPLSAPLRAEFRPDQLGGVVVVKASVASAVPDGGSRELVAVPYFAWANRGKGEMAVWVPAGAESR